MTDGAERALLGGLLTDPAQLPLVQSILVGGDFAREAHRRLWDVLVQRSAAGQPIGTVELAGDMTPATWRLLGGAAYVAELPESCPATANLAYYAGQVRAAAQRRRLVTLAERLVAAARDGTEDTEVVAELAVRDLTALSAPPSLDSTLGEAWREAERVRGSEERLSTGFPQLDAMLDGGLAAEDVTVVGARPSMGKTAFALSLAAMVGRHHPVGVVSLEMRTTALADRLLAFVSNVPHSAIRTGERTPDEAGVLDVWRGRLPDVHLWHEPGASLSRVVGRIRQWWALHRVKLVVLDYLTLVREQPAYPGEARPQVVGRVMQALKDLAQQLRIHIVVLSQLNRDVERRPAPRRAARSHRDAWWLDVVLPTEGDLVWSSEVEAIADALVFPLRADRTGVPDPQLHNAAVLYLLKNRHGPTGFVPAYWHGPTASYRPMAVASLGPGV